LEVARDKKRKEATKGYNRTAYLKYKALPKEEKQRIRVIENAKRRIKLEENPELLLKQREYNRNYYYKNKEKLVEYAKNWRKKNIVPKKGAKKGCKDVK
jgi:hypothetical protein